MKIQLNSILLNLDSDQLGTCPDGRSSAARHSIEAGIVRVNCLKLMNASRIPDEPDFAGFVDGLAKHSLEFKSPDHSS